MSGYLTKSGLPFGKVLEQRTRTLFVPLLIFGVGGGYYCCADKIESSFDYGWNNGSM